MENDLPKEATDVTLQKLKKDDLYDLSVDDLEQRIASLRDEITRCTDAIKQRDTTRNAAEKLFKQ